MSTGWRTPWPPAIVAAIAALSVALFGGLATDIGPWYAALKKPGWQPPDWLFGPAWTLIFTLTATAGVLTWNNATSAAERRLIVTLFALNGLLNVAWTLLFFRLHRPDWALYELLALWSSIAVLIVLTGRIATAAGWLLVPYLAWVTFAGVLNAMVVRLNGPFG